MNKIRPITILINHIINKMDLSFLNSGYKSNDTIGGRPFIDNVCLLKVYLLSLYEGLSFRTIIEKLNKLDSDYAYLAQDLKVIPKKSTLSNFLKNLDVHIEQIFYILIDYIHKDIKLDLDNLFCDGTPFEAHNSRNKIITETNITKSNNKWKTVLESVDSTPNEKVKASNKLKENDKRKALLSELGRKSYGRTDIDSVIIQDKNKNFIAGFNAQLIEEEKFGMIIFVHMSNKNPDSQVFIESLDKLLLQYKPKTITLDKGYGNIEILKKLKACNITCYVKTVKNDNSISKLNFLSFELSKDETYLTCPLGLVLPRAKIKLQDKISFKMTACKNCNNYQTCFKIFKGRITFDPVEYQLMKEAKKDLESDKGIEKYNKRGNKCESPHGFIKYNLKDKKLTMNGIKRAKTILILNSILYNLVRYLSIKTNKKG